jgi:hypothetical protein
MIILKEKKSRVLSEGAINLETILNTTFKSVSLEIVGTALLRAYGQVQLIKSGSDLSIRNKQQVIGDVDISSIKSIIKYSDHLGLTLYHGGFIDLYF